MKDLKNNVLLLLAGMGLLIFSCNAQTDELGSKTNEYFLSDSTFVSKLKALSLIKNQEKITGPFEFFIRDTPTLENPYFIIQAGKTNNYRFEVFYNFYCYPKSASIKLYDTLNDTLVNAY